MRAIHQAPFRTKLFITAILIAIIATCVWWAFAIYEHFSVLEPARGGAYSEAVVGQPQFINPLLAPASPSSADRLLARVIYSGLYMYDVQGELKADLAESFVRSEDGKTYTVTLREGITWHDGTPFSAEDVKFTTNIAKDISYEAVANPLRAAWNNVIVNVIDGRTVEFRLDKPRGDFLHLLTLGIIPKHVWEDVASAQFQLATYNTKPIGTGPYEFVDAVADQSGVVSEYVLRAYEGYHHGEPLVTKFTFQFYEDRAQAIEAYTGGLVNGVSATLNEHITALTEDAEAPGQIRMLQRPSYFALFFNQNKNFALAFDEVREALALAVDRDAMIQDILGQAAFPVQAPLLAGMKGFEEEKAQENTDIERANSILDAKGWKRGEDGMRSRGGEEAQLAFAISVREDRAELVRIAERLAQQWEQIGARVTLDLRSPDDLEAQVIKDREYAALLTFHPMRWDQPNIRALWHSKERDYPGLNYAGVDDGPLDTALDALQIESDEEARTVLYGQVQGRIRNENPAVFLFATQFLFAHSDDLRGVSVSRVNAPQDRYAEIHRWYTTEKPVFRLRTPEPIN